MYNLNSRDHELIATMMGNFQDATVPGKMQFGSGWWYNDQKDGIEQQLNVLSNMRHEYFRRILCNLLGDDVENGELPYDIELIGNMVKDICYRNAVDYFGIEVN
jgi:glucuronate isomerase